MPWNQFRNREIRRITCLRDFAGLDSVRSAWFDATSLTANSEGRFQIPIGSFLTVSATNPTKVKIFENLGTSANAVQTLTMTGTPTGGTFTLEYNGQTSVALPYSATAAEIAAALVKLSTVGTAENLVAAGGAFPGTAVTITFKGELGNTPQPLIVPNYTGLTGGTTPKVTATTTTPGATAEKIIGVFNGPDKDFWGDTVSADEPIPVYFHACTFDITKLPQWLQYGALAEKALANCNFY